MPEIKTIQAEVQKYGLSLPLVHYLTQYLLNHPHSQTIPLPGKTAGPNDLPRQQAFQLIYQYLEDQNAPSKLLEKFTSDLPEKTRLNLAFQEIIQEKTTLKTQTATHTQLLEEYSNYLKSLEKTSSTESLQKALKEFRSQINSYHKNLLLLQKTIYQNPLQKDLLPDDSFTSKKKEKLIEQLAKTLPLAKTSADLNQNPDTQTLFQELNQLTESSPELDKFLSLNNTQPQQEKLLQLTQDVNQNLQQQNQTSLTKIHQQQVKVNSYPQKSLFPKRQEAVPFIAHKLQQTTDLNTKEAANLSQEIFNQSVKSAHLRPLLYRPQPQEPETLIQNALKKTTGRTISKDSGLIKSLEPFFPLIQSHHETQYMEARQKRKTTPFSFLLPSEVKLALRTNTNPATTTANYNPDIKSFLGVDKAQKPTHPQLLQEIQIFQQQEIAKTQPDFQKIQTANFFQNYLQEKINLKTANHPLLKGFTQIKSGVRKITSRAQILRNQAWEYWYSFEEKLPHRWVARKLDHLTFETKFPGYFLAPGYHLSRGWYNLKQNLTSRVLQNSSKGSFPHWLASRFYEGSYSFSGFFKSSARWGISKAYQGAKKLGKKAFKKVGSFLAKKAAEWGLEGLIGTLSGPVGAAIAVGTAIVQATVFIWKNRRELAELAKKALLFVSGAALAIYKVVAALIAQATAAFTGAIAGGVVAGVLSALGIISGGWAVVGIIGAGAAIGWGINWLVVNSSTVLAGASSAISSVFTTITAATTGSTVGSIVISSLSAVGISAILYHVTITTAQLPYDQQGNVVAGSPFIQISKKAQAPFDSPDSLHIKNSSLQGNEIKYEVQINAVDKSLQELSISDTLTIWQENASGKVVKRTLQTHSTSTKTLSPEDPAITLQYTQSLSPDHADSLLINDVQVKATVEGKTETKNLSYSISIGDPPVLPATKFAQKLAAAINNCYGPSVTLSDGGTCLKNASDAEIAQTSSLTVPILQDSANKYTYVQCVAFARAVEKATGSSLAGKNAFQYIQGAPSGYTYYTGTSGIMPGDLFLIAHGDYAGSFGHIGIVTKNAGDLIIAADENWNGQGEARSQAAFPKDEIAGYLRRNQ